MNYLDDFKWAPWLLSRPVSRHSEEVEEEEVPSVSERKIPTIWGSFQRERKFIIIKMEKKFLDKAAEFLEVRFNYAPLKF